MATIYNFHVRCVSAFIALPDEEIKKIIEDALKNYKHKSGLRLESIEINKVE